MRASRKRGGIRSTNAAPQKHFYRFPTSPVPRFLPALELTSRTSMAMVQPRLAAYSRMARPWHGQRVLVVGRNTSIPAISPRRSGRPSYASGRSPGPARENRVGKCRSAWRASGLIADLAASCRPARSSTSAPDPAGPARANRAAPGDSLARAWTLPTLPTVCDLTRVIPSAAGLGVQDRRACGWLGRYGPW